MTGRPSSPLYRYVLPFLRLAFGCRSGLGKYTAPCSGLYRYSRLTITSDREIAMSDLLPVATMMPLVAGIAAATLASQSEQFGHRRLAFIASFLYPSAVYGLSALAVNAASLPLFATSYALLGGLGFYCGYPSDEA